MELCVTLKLLVATLQTGRSWAASAACENHFFAGGLCCAHELTKRGFEVLEVAGRSGGRILTLRDRLADGLYVDAGAERFYRPVTSSSRATSRRCSCP
jgi:hypothetical protein